MNPGRIHLRVLWDGATVTAVEIGNSRPQSFRLLRGRKPAEAHALVPLLFNACRQGQSVAARSALAVAEGREEADEGIALAAEWAQEHLWRLLLDWPRVLGQEADLKTYSAWHRRLGEVAARRNWDDAGAELKAFCERRLFGMDASAWLASGAASALTAGLETPAPTPADTALLPAGLTARDYYQAMSANLDAGYARRPTWNGAAAETGPYARRHRLSPVAAAPSRITGRMMARLAELSVVARHAATNAAPGPLSDAFAPESGSGFAVAETARGLLVHWVRLEQGRIADYVIVAPTEWNFHPAGPFGDGLVGLEARDRETVERQARQLALTLDPCVPYEIEVRLQ